MTEKKNKDNKEEKEPPKPKENGRKAEKATPKEQGGGSSWFSLLTTLALVGVILALVVTVHKLNTQIASERKLYGNQIQEIEAEAASARTKATVAESEKLDAVSKVTNLENQVAQSKAALQKAEVETAASKGMMKTTQEAIESASKDHAELGRKTTQEIRQLQTDITKHENSHLEKEKQIKQLQDSLTEAQQQAKQKAEAEGNAIQEKTRLAARVQELEGQLAKDEQGKVQNLEALNQKTAQLAEMEQQQQKATNEIEEMKATLQDRDFVVWELEEKYKKSLDKVKVLVDEVNQLKYPEAQQSKQGPTVQEAEKLLAQQAQQQQQQQPNPA